MKKILLIVSMLPMGILQAQTYSDNFDTYSADSTMASQSAGFWTTWSGLPGGSEDVLVSEADAASAPNSCYFSSNNQGGGPTDLVRNFGLLNSGLFSLNFNIKVEESKSGYFNFQKEIAIGTTWAMDCYFKDNDSLVINNLDGLFFGSVYQQAVWFNFRIDIDFDANLWEVFINDVSVGSFTNSYNQIASIDIYPNDLVTPFASGYYIDDFEYTIGEADTTSNVNELNIENTIVTLYPNPATDFAIVSLDLKKKSLVTAKILNTTGQLISSETFGYLFGQSKINLNTSLLESGIYFVEIYSGESKITKRLVVN